MTPTVSAVDVADRLAAARRVVVVTGAGVSAPSGLATYRDGDEHWADRALESVSSRQRWKANLPALWDHWGAMRAAVLAARPNAAHTALAAAAADRAAVGGWLVVATQNVDGLHTAAGSADVVELHGSLRRSRCVAVGCGPAFDDDRVPAPGEVLGCVRCDRACRPDVVLFGESLRSKDWKGLAARLRSADAVVVAGTSGVVYPAAGAVDEARSGALRVLANAEVWDDADGRFDVAVTGSADEILPALFGV